MQKNNSLVKAVNKNVRSSPRKISLVLDYIRGKKVDTIINKLKGETRISLKLTLGNCIIYKVNHTILVLKEH